MKSQMDYFRELFNDEPLGHVRSPLRVCPLGAHVDHQHGLVTGMALDVSVDLVYSPDEEGFIRVQSMDFPDEDYFHLDRVPEVLPGFWGNYLRGAVLSLSRYYRLRRGIRGVIRGKLPMGGLSTSAAVTTAYLLALCDVNGISPSKEDLIQWSHWVEVSYIGLNNGILDQSANVLSRKGFLMLMDCKTNKWDLIAQGRSMPEFEIIIVNSGFTKALIGTDYNNRVDECKIAASILEECAHGRISNYKDVRLRNVSREDYEKNRDRLPGRFGLRAQHFYTEYDRVERGVVAWKTGDIASFGKLMFESGDSSVEAYQCGCPELITIFETLKSCPGVYGARFSGAGYRGCCIGLIDPSHRSDIQGVIDKIYPSRHPAFAEKYSVHFCKTADGASIVKCCDNGARK